MSLVMNQIMAKNSNLNAAGKKQLIATNSENEYLYKHFNAKIGFARINVVTKPCTCHKYLDKGICKHLIAACILTQSSLPGLVQMSKKFRIFRRKKIANTETIVVTKTK